MIIKLYSTTLQLVWGLNNLEMEHIFFIKGWELINFEKNSMLVDEENNYISFVNKPLLESLNQIIYNYPDIHHLSLQDAVNLAKRKS